MAGKREGHYIGVTKCLSGRYSAHTTWKKIKHGLGTFDTPEQAALAYDSAVMSLRGSKAKTNFPVPEGGVVVAPIAIRKRSQYRGVRKRGRWNKTRNLLGRFDEAARSLRGSKARTIFPAAETGGSGCSEVVEASSEMVETKRVETMLFSDIIGRGLPVDLNEPPPPCAVLFLASQDSLFITGQNLLVDAGLPGF